MLGGRRLEVWVSEKRKELGRHLNLKCLNLQLAWLDWAAPVYFRSAVDMTDVGETGRGGGAFLVKESCPQTREGEQSTVYTVTLNLLSSPDPSALTLDGPSFVGAQEAHQGVESQD